MAAKAGAHPVLLLIASWAVAPLRPRIAGSVTDRMALVANNVQSFMIQHLERS
jgi:hypothetical protein